LIHRLKNRQEIFGYVCAISATALWSGNLIIARDLNESIAPISLAFWRWLVAVIVFLPFALKSLIAEWDIIKENILYLSVTAILGITIFNTLIYFAAHTTTAINLSLISITFPVFIVIFSRIFYRELITINRGIGILLVSAGVIFLITGGNISRLIHISFAIGDIWMLVAAIIFAIYSLLLKHRPNPLSLWAFQLSTFILGLLFLSPFFVWEYLRGAHFEYEPKTICSILYVGIFASLSAFVLWHKAVEMVGPSKAGMIYYILPVFSGFMAYLFLKEDIGIIHFCSALLIITGILTANYESKRYVP